MAADQRRKRLNGASITGCSSKEKQKMKKKKLDLPKNDPNTRSYISLEWDRNKKKVVAKREQVCISWRDLRPFTESVPHCQNILGDVFSVPMEVFDLSNLTEVLSYEAWQSYLSENERNFLTQFLPRGTDVQQVVQALLSGDNFHFGNPMLEWGTTLCSGNLHPDAVLHREQCLKDDKRAYYSEMQKYHYDMVGYLQKLKERWESCKDPEREIVQKIWSRSRRDVEKKVLSRANGSKFRDLEQDITATSESCSWIADEKACSSDNQNTYGMKGGEPHKRVSRKGLGKGKFENPFTASDEMQNVGARSRKGDNLQKHNIHLSDGAKYMSYLKISKKQHQLVTNMKQSGKSIQSRSLNRVLGNIDRLHVQPYEVFVEEERKKLQEHWLRLTKKDLPVAYTNWKNIQLQKQQMIKYLERDMQDKLNLEDKGKENPEMMPQDQGNIGLYLCEKDGKKEDNESVVPDHDNIETDNESIMEDNEDSGPGSLHNDSTQCVSSPSDGEELNSTLQVSSLGGGDDLKSGLQVSSSSGGDELKSTLQISSPSGVDELKRKGVDSVDNNCASKSDDSSSNVSEHSGNLNDANVTINEGLPLSSAGDLWPEVNMVHPYYDSTANRDYSSTVGLSLSRRQPNEEHQGHLIDLESDLHEEDTRRDMLNRDSNGGSFGSFANQDRNELLQSLFKGQGMLSYNHEQKQTELDFQPRNNVLMEDGRFSGGHIQDQLQPSLQVEQGQKRHNEVCMQHVSGHSYSEGGRYLIPRQEHLLPVGMPDWNVNSVRISGPIQSQLNNGELLSQNWFSGQHQVRSGWAVPDGIGVGVGVGPAIGNGNNADQSLFSVLSHCSQLRSGGHFDSVGSAEPFVAPRNYGMISGPPPGIGNGLSQAAANPLDFLGGRDPSATLMPDDMGWMNLPHQNSALHDLMGKPYLRSWNQ